MSTNNDAVRAALTCNLKDLETKQAEICDYLNVLKTRERIQSEEAGRLLRSLTVCKSRTGQLSQASKKLKLPARLLNPPNPPRMLGIKTYQQAPGNGQNRNIVIANAPPKMIPGRQYHKITLDNICNNQFMAKLVEVAQRKRGYLAVFCAARRYKVMERSIFVELAKNKRHLQALTDSTHQMSTRLSKTRNDLRRLQTAKRQCVAAAQEAAQLLQTLTQPLARTSTPAAHQHPIHHTPPPAGLAIANKTPTAARAASIPTPAPTSHSSSSTSSSSKSSSSTSSSSSSTNGGSFGISFSQ